MNRKSTAAPPKPISAGIFGAHRKETDSNALEVQDVLKKLLDSIVPRREMFGSMRYQKHFGLSSKHLLNRAMGPDLYASAVACVKFVWPELTAHSKTVPKRFKRLARIFCNVLENNGALPYKRLLHRYCSVPPAWKVAYNAAIEHGATDSATSVSETLSQAVSQLLHTAVPPAQVFRFVWEAVLQLFPMEMFGGGDNRSLLKEWCWRIVASTQHSVVAIRQTFQGLRLRDFSWAWRRSGVAGSRKQRHTHAKTDFAIAQAVVGGFLKLLFCEIVPELVRNHFFVTTGEKFSGGTDAPIFFLRPVWRAVLHLGSLQLEHSGLLTEICPAKALSIQRSLTGQTVCAAPMKFVPKGLIVPPAQHANLSRVPPTGNKLRLRPFSGDKPREREMTRTAIDSGVAPPLAKLRPIMRLSTGVVISERGQRMLPKDKRYLAPNRRLEPVLAAIRLELKRRPELWGAGIGKRDGIYPKLKAFLAKWTQACHGMRRGSATTACAFDLPHFSEGCDCSSRCPAVAAPPLPLWIVTADVSRCYDRLNQGRVLHRVAPLFFPPGAVYAVQRYCVLKMGRGATKKFHARAWRIDSQGVVEDDETMPPGFQHYVSELAANSPANNRNCLFVLCRMHGPTGIYPSQELCGMIEDVVQRGVVVGPDRRLFHRTKGVPQGATISPALCNATLGMLERKNFAWLPARSDGSPTAAVSEASGQKRAHEAFCDSALFRMVDDYLLVTTCLWSARTFVRTLHRNFPEWGVCLNAARTCCNFAADETAMGGCTGPIQLVTQRWMQWCGLLIDSWTGSVLMLPLRLGTMALSGCVSPRYHSQLGKWLLLIVRPWMQYRLSLASVDVGGTTTVDCFFLSVFSAASVVSMKVMNVFDGMFQLDTVQSRVPLLAKLILSTARIGGSFASRAATGKQGWWLHRAVFEAIVGFAFAAVLKRHRVTCGSVPGWSGSGRVVERLVEGAVKAVCSAFGEECAARVCAVAGSVHAERVVRSFF